MLNERNIKGSKSQLNQYVKKLLVLNVIFFDLIIGFMRNKLKIFVLNGKRGNSSYRDAKTHIPWLQ